MTAHSPPATARLHGCSTTSQPAETASRSPKPTAPRPWAGARSCSPRSRSGAPRPGAPNTTTPSARSAVSSCRCNAPTATSTSSYDPTTGQIDRVTLSQYYASEAMWALARLQNALPDDSYRTAALRAAHFVSTERNDRDFVPVGPLNDHWAAHAFAEMASWPIGDAEAALRPIACGPVRRAHPVGGAEGQRRAVLVDARTDAPRRGPRHVGRGSGRARPPRPHRPPPRGPARRHPRERGVRRGSAHRPPARWRRPRVSAARGSTRGRAAWTTSNTRSRACWAWPTCWNRSTDEGRAAPRGVPVRAARPDRGRDRRRRRSPTSGTRRRPDPSSSSRAASSRSPSSRWSRAWPTRSSTGCGSPPARPSSRPGSW